MFDMLEKKFILIDRLPLFTFSFITQVLSMISLENNFYPEINFMHEVLSYSKDLVGTLSCHSNSLGTFNIGETNKA